MKTPPLVKVNSILNWKGSYPIHPECLAFAFPFFFTLHNVKIYLTVYLNFNNFYIPQGIALKFGTLIHHHQPNVCQDQINMHFDKLFLILDLSQ